LIRDVDRLSVTTPVRWTGLLVTVLAAAIAGVLALPESSSDRSADTVYPLMMLPALVTIGVAGLVAACRPAAAGVAAVIGGVNGLQVTGIAVVASHDWRNFAGVDYSSWERGYAGSRLALLIAVLGTGVIVASAVLYRHATRRNQRLRSQPVALVAGAAVAILLPALLRANLHLSGLPAIGQFALWWSLPWAAGVVAVGAAPTRGLRRAALASVVVSVALTLVCVALEPFHGFGLRLPEQ
jgi:hypothetical protein